jgi:hypothetical protein
MNCAPSPRPANIQRKERRDECRLALSKHLSILHFHSFTVPPLTKVRETVLGIKIEPAQVRLQPGIEDGYVWKPVPNNEHRFKKELFGKQLSKHSIGAYTELCRGVGVSFEAAPLFNSGNMPCSEPEGEPTEVRVILMVLRRHALMSRLVRKHLHIERHPLIKDQLFTAGKCKTYPRPRHLERSGSSGL